MNNVGYIYDDIFLLHKMPSGHPESKHRLIAINNKLRETAYWDKLVHISPRKADKRDIITVHTDSYYESLINFTGYYDPDTYISENTTEAALFAAGAALEAVDRCKSAKINRVFCSVRPPGHHAESDRAMGFCIFNNVAAGARYAQSCGFNKVFIVDFDVHHGNGTQHIFEEDPSVFYFSTHQHPHYPGTGSESEKGKGKGIGFSYNIPMYHGAGDSEYFNAYHNILPGLVKNFDPDLIFVSAGYDLHINDPLSGIKVSDEGIRNIIRGILSSKKNIPFIFCLEGGYNLSSLSDSVVITIEEMFSVE